MHSLYSLRSFCNGTNLHIDQARTKKLGAVKAVMSEQGAGGGPGPGPPPSKVGGGIV